MTKKFLSALLAVLMVVSMVPMAAMAAEGDNPPAVDGGENKGENGSDQGDEATG